MIIEVALCGICSIRRRQDGVNQFFGSGFAVAAGDSDEGDVELLTMV